MNRNLVRTLVLGLCAGMLIAGLWPFNFRALNHAQWRPDGKGIQFSRPSILYSDGEFDFGRSLTAAGRSTGISIEMLLMPEPKWTGESHCILSLYNEDIPENLQIAESESGIILRTSAWNRRGQKRLREISVYTTLRNGSARFIALASGPEGTTLYLDGNPLKSFPKLSLRPDALRGRLILGAASEGGQNWIGRFFGLAVFQRPLDAKGVLRHYRMWTGSRAQDLAFEAGISTLYIFDEGGGRTIRNRIASQPHLLMPEFYRSFSKTVLHPPWSEYPFSRSTLKDIGVNILGFIPFGFFYFTYRVVTRPGIPIRNAIATILAGGMISLSIELLQVYLPTRDSSLLDVICNILGSFAGVLLVAAWQLPYRSVRYLTHCLERGLQKL